MRSHAVPSKTNPKGPSIYTLRLQGLGIRVNPVQPKPPFDRVGRKSGKPRKQPGFVLLTDFYRSCVGFIVLVRVKSRKIFLFWLELPGSWLRTEENCASAVKPQKKKG